MSILELFAVLLAAVAGTALVGLVPAASLRRVPADVRSALVLPMGAAIITCSSTLTILGAPVRAVAIALAAASAAAIVAERRHLKALAAGFAAPCVVAVAALALASIPAVGHRSWDAASPGNGDLYWWVSQSRDLLDGPAPAPTASHPDRDLYERVVRGDAPLGVPFDLSLVSLASGKGPDRIYSAFAAVVAAVLALVVYAVARIALQWRRRWAQAAALLVSANAFLLFASFFGWQAQLLITAFGLLGIAGTYAALEGGSPRAFIVLGALGAAAGVATYGAVFAPFVAFGVFVVVAYRALNRDDASHRRVTRAVGGVAVMTAVFGAVPIVRSLIDLHNVVGDSDSSIWAGSQAGVPSEPLGLVPRVAWSERASTGWTALSVALAVPLYAAGFAGARRQRAKVILFWGSAAALAVIVLVELFAPNPYLSLKLAGYAAPLLMLTVIAAARLPVQPFARFGSLVAAGLAAILFALSSVVVEIRQSRTTHHTDAIAGLEAAGARLPASARVRVDIADAWNQGWALYYLRERALVIRHPQYFVSRDVVAGERAAHARTNYVLATHAAGRVVWRGGNLVLSEASPTR